MADRETRRQPGREPSVIVNVIEVLRCFTVDEPQQSVTGISSQVGLHKSTVSRILATLEDERIVERDEPSRRYQLGLGLIAVAGPLLANLDVRRVSLDELQDLAAETAETAALTIWDGESSVTVEQVASRLQVKHTSELGSRYSTGLSASVQVLLAHRPPGEAQRLLDTGRVTIPPSLSTEQHLDLLAQVRRQGFAVNHAQTSADEAGVAAPVRDHRGEVVAAMMIAAPAFRVPETRIPELVQLCRHSADRVSRRLGAAPQPS
ncbi:IclR family transcriptional regulator [Nesterenkonia sp. PF2B19]|uniref:IclR family transcriptional regulator n=1 Tax=unclassified Nesterenkonia TaxID=2629769 RepID=UPI0008727FC0|nr:IclR family transcriptional regulator [Nesterenkonia sp. PF2B19]OSM44027.1 ArsR family transcriptional regulator [Nesterenkonia sp. PF2B19]